MPGRVTTIILCLLLGTALRGVRADGPADNDPQHVRPVPPPGIYVAEKDKAALQEGLAVLGEAVEQLRSKQDSLTQELLPDVEIFHRAVDQALRFNEMFVEKDVRNAEQVLREGMSRAESLLAGEAPWTAQSGLVVRGYRSRLDDTVQPYGLVIPPSYKFRGGHFEGTQKHRCDVWLHGRGETSCELQFIAARMNTVGQIEPKDTIVLHPFGRYSNAFKFAGEVDVFEALEHAKTQYRIDPDRIAIRGFSMGGAGTWHLAVHHADRWFAATPGAGFSETPEFLKSFQDETVSPTPWEQTLWRWYDCPWWVANLRHCPTIAYSGEIDRQKQAADVMERAYRDEKINELALVHLIGPGTAHKLHPDSLADIEGRLERLAAIDKFPAPRRVHFETYTLKYNRMHWVTINGLDRHWERASVDARIDTHGEVTLDHSNVNDLTIRFETGVLTADSRFGSIISPLTIVFRDLHEEKGDWPVVTLKDDDRLRVLSDGSFECRFLRTGQSWKIYEEGDSPGLVKRHNLQGPIDDAFMDSFLFVSPSGRARSAAVKTWTQSELQRAVDHWRKQMRGDARIKPDSEVTEEDIARHNLVLWGDPQSNSLIARVLPDLPVEWTPDRVAIGRQSFEGPGRVPVLIYPNPLNPSRYVVLNSSFTYREYDYLNNARQTPKLPDWAIIDMSEPPNSRWPGKIVAADFFDDQWQPRVRE